jgi:hypothetical protein
MNGISQRKTYMETQKTIGNVNVLNLIHATPESVAGIRQINNINLALCTPQTAPLLQRLNPRNINSTLLVPEGAQLVIKLGSFTINADFFRGIEKPVFFIITGKLIIDPGVTPQDIERGLAGLALTGKLLCPESLMGPIHSNANTITGKTMTYTPLARVVNGDWTLDSDTLNGLDDASEICVMGDLTLNGVLPGELLERKLSKLFVSGDISCHAENAPALRARLDKYTGDMQVIPAGFTLVKKPLNIDRDLLDYLPGKKLFCQEQVIIAADVDAAALDASLDSLVASDLLISPSALRPLLARKCSLFDTRSIFYPDALWLVQDEQKGQAWRFAEGAPSTTLVVTGELALDPGIPSAAIAAHLSKVYNYGLIRCAPEQQGAIEAHLAVNEGALQGFERQPEEEDTQDQIGNVNYLTL